MVVTCGVRSQGIPQNERSEPTVENKHPKFPTSWDQRNSLPHGLLRDAFSTEPRSTCLFGRVLLWGQQENHIFIPSWMSSGSPGWFHGQSTTREQRGALGSDGREYSWGQGRGANIQWLHGQVQALERSAS